MFLFDLFKKEKKEEKLEISELRHIQHITHKYRVAESVLFPFGTKDNIIQDLLKAYKNKEKVILEHKTKSRIKNKRFAKKTDFGYIEEGFDYYTTHVGKLCEHDDTLVVNESIYEGYVYKKEKKLENFEETEDLKDKTYYEIVLSHDEPEKNEEPINPKNFFVVFPLTIDNITILDKRINYDIQRRNLAKSKRRNESKGHC